MSSLDGLAPLLGRSRADLQVDHLSSQDPVDRVVQPHLVRLAPLLPVQLAVHLVLRADCSIEFLTALGRRGVNGLSHALLEALLLVLAEPEPCADPVEGVGLGGDVEFVGVFETEREAFQNGDLSADQLENIPK